MALAFSPRTPPLTTLSGGSRRLRHGRHMAIIGPLEVPATMVLQYTLAADAPSAPLFVALKNIYKSFRGTPSPALFWKRMPPVLIVLFSTPS